MASKKRDFVGHITGVHPDANGFNADYDAETYDTIDDTDTPVYTLQQHTPIRQDDISKVNMIPASVGDRCAIVVWPDDSGDGSTVIDRFDLYVRSEKRGTTVCNA